MALREATYNPALQNSPVNLYNQRSPYDPYATRFNSAGTPVFSTPLLAPDIDPTITPTWPAQFTDMAFWMSLKKRAVQDIVYNWTEAPWIHNPIAVRTNTAAVAAVANTVVQQTVPITDASIPFVRPGDKVMYNLTSTTTTAQGIVATMVTTLGAGTITINSMEGKGFPAVTTADTLQNHGPITADGFSTIYSHTMPETLMYNNYLEIAGAYAQRWDPMQKHIWKLKGNADYVKFAAETTYMRLLTTMQARLLMSTADRSFLPDGVSYTTTTSGLLEQMTNAGVVTETVTSAQAVDAIRSAVFDTALNTGGTKVLMGTREMLNTIGAAQKANLVRYSPEGTTWNMDINEYIFSGYRTVEVPMDQWKDVALYGPNMQKQVLIMNKEDMEINYLQGWPMISREHTLLNENDHNPSTGLNIDLVWYKACFGFTLHKAFASRRIQIL